MHLEASHQKSRTLALRESRFVFKPREDIALSHKDRQVHCRGLEGRSRSALRFAVGYLRTEPVGRSVR